MPFMDVNSPLKQLLFDFKQYKNLTKSTIEILPSSGQTSCLDCPKGYQQHEVAAPFCLPCNPGKTNSQEGQESCQVCGAGTHMPFSKSIAPTCTNCIAGQYEEKGGATSCTSCPAGTYSAVVGSAALINCGTLRCSCVFVF